MKLHALALSVSAALLLPLSAQAAPKVYGQLNISAESYQKDNQSPATSDEDYTRLQSNSSRFGVRGEDELTVNLSAVYGIEWGVSADGEGAVGTVDLSQRNRFVGIKHKNLGTVKAGKFDTYLKTAQGKTDLFNDFTGDIQFTIAGEDRVNNAIGYESPSFKGLQFNVLSQTQDVAAKATNGTSLSVVYDNKDIGLYSALGVNKSIVGRSALFGTAREGEGIRFAVGYTVSALNVNAIYSTNENVNGNDGEKAYLLGAAYKLGDVVLKAQYSIAEADDEAKVAVDGSTEKSSFSLGADYNITSKTRAFVWYTTLEDVKKDAVVPVANDVEETALALGVEHKF